MTAAAPGIRTSKRAQMGVARQEPIPRSGMLTSAFEISGERQFAATPLGFLASSRASKLWKFALAMKLVVGRGVLTPPPPKPRSVPAR